MTECSAHDDEMWYGLKLPGVDPVFLPGDVDVPFMMRELLGSKVQLVDDPEGEWEGLFVLDQPLTHEDILRVKRAAQLLCRYHYAERGIWIPEPCCDEAIYVP